MRNLDLLIVFYATVLLPLASAAVYSLARYKGAPVQR
jgi:hypothetical protein